MDIYLNGTLLDDDVTVTTSGLSANAFRMYNINLGNTGVDDITLWNEAVAPVPEPSTYALLALSGLALAGYAARRRHLK